MVVCCIHDEGMGSVDAPNLLGSIYRRILDYAARGHLTAIAA